ncbi:uncharacterized protein B0I36DRAFT_237958 [Microdochium trichocladiopsis]|uniref:Zn(2)-C6 fungal-type domain-containing protein n=1 Tax=Microdochium trichocladiopsis TaxID=1682393 RepID=A0A9P9BV57_9PEZI|nr:uncharacterized protein B0I36DRAFT_237958 [Microdochium trichocladiopsis]KAH7038144.1 hypothetical protein B0I36DRAFT_237958 [Microdochium trichocladiopsis]
MPRVFNKSCSNTCRYRKIKCDQAQPICGQCSRIGRYCDRAKRAPKVRQELRHSAEQADDSSKDCGGAATPVTSPRDALQSSRTADFFQHYIAELAPWYDLSDGRRHFAVQVPILALDEALLFNALMALSAMHLARTSMPSARPAAESYHGMCIHALIGLTESDSRLLENGIALAATCLLRSYEILSEDADPNRHLQGAYSLASQPHRGFGHDHASTGSLLLQGFWNYLREDITFSLFGECPLKIDLAAVFVPPSATGTDHDHLNNMSVVLGSIINGLFGRNATSSDTSWTTWIGALRGWIQQVAGTVYPFSRAAGKAVASDLPSVRVLQDCHASAWHYFLVALCVLSSRAPAQKRQADIIELASSYQPHFSECKGREEFLEAAAMEICGIAFTSNSPAVIVNAFGPISFCARFIHDKAVQEDIIRHLFACQKRTGWPVQRIVGRLEAHWKAELGHR